MRVLFDILHPAHVHFFRNAIRELEAAGAEVIVTARDKDIAVPLLEEFGIPHTVLSREAKSRGGLLKELAARNLALFRIVRKKRPQVMAGIGGISTAQVGFLTRTPNVIFYDTEVAGLQNLLSFPFATEVATPGCYRARVLGRHYPYDGFHELAYLYRERFTPDRELLSSYGVEEPYSVLRFVSWRAVHDTRIRGVPLEGKRRLASALSTHGKVYVSSEDPVPEGVGEPVPIPAKDVHHLLAFASLYAGESATMASEAVLLGTPAVYLDPAGRGYNDEQERRGFCRRFPPEEWEEAVAHAMTILDGNEVFRAGFRERLDTFLAEKIDVTSLILERLSHWAKR